VVDGGWGKNEETGKWGSGGWGRKRRSDPKLVAAVVVVSMAAREAEMWVGMEDVLEGPLAAS
jgi:hypothetical protein